MSTARWMMHALMGLIVAYGGPMGLAAAKDDAATPQPVRPAPAAPPPAPVSSPSAKPMSPEDAVRSQLDGTTWALTFTPRSEGGKVKVKEDTVTFKKTMVDSERLGKSGYEASNYTLTIPGNKMPVWETMQSNDKDGVVFWRGEIQGSAMQGILSERPPKGKSVDYSFSGSEASGKTIAVPQPQAASAPPPPPKSQPTAASAPMPAKAREKSVVGH